MDQAAVIATGGVFLPGHLAEPLWRVLRTEIGRRRADGGQVRPDMAQALDVLRAAAVAHMSAQGHDSRTLADMGAPCEEKPLVSTSDLATRLGVTERHARRVARTEGVEPAGRNLWHRADVAALETRRGA